MLNALLLLHGLHLDNVSPRSFRLPQSSVSPAVKYIDCWGGTSRYFLSPSFFPLHFDVQKSTSTVKLTLANPLFKVDVLTINHSWSRLWLAMSRAETASSSRGWGWSLLLLAGLSALHTSSSSATGHTPLSLHTLMPLPAGGRLATGSNRGSVGLEAGSSRTRGWALRGGEGVTEEAAMHQAEVAGSPAAWVACPMAGCGRFVSLKGVAPDSSAQVSQPLPWRVTSVIMHLCSVDP